jgi:hypothetical protein
MAKAYTIDEIDLKKITYDVDPYTGMAGFLLKVKPEGWNFLEMKRSKKKAVVTYWRPKSK